MSYINRAIEPLLIKKYQSYKSVAVTGARQVGRRLVYISNMCQKVTQ